MPRDISRSARFADIGARQSWAGGVARAIPIVLGYVPVGIAYGVLANKAGLSALNTMLMSVMVYAGASQLIAVGLFMAHVPAASIIITTFAVNLRHFIMASAIAGRLKRWRKIELAAFAYELTDETFAVHSMARFSDDFHKSAVFATNITAQVSWVTGSWIGFAAGSLIGDIRVLALDYALPAMFIALLVGQIRNRIQILVACIAGTLAVVLLLAGLSHWHIMVASLIGASLGVFIEEGIKKLSA
ncbi:MAG: AzlC family ABC transporter permease [Deltaproteobacteria bacterium]|nr:AzlC family ABC transporter permease [Deltaproteobacteria bacterium]